VQHPARGSGGGPRASGCSRPHRLLEEVEACTRERTHVLHRLLRAPALIGIGGDEGVGSDQRADVARALGIDERLVDADLDLESDIALRLLAFRLAEVGGELAGADDAENGHASSHSAAEERVGGLASGAADEVVQRHLDCGLGRRVRVHARPHGRDGARNIFRWAAFDRRRKISDRRHHALDRLAGHGGSGCGLAPTECAVVCFDAHEHVVRGPDLHPRHEHGLLHRNGDRNRLDPLDFHGFTRFIV
jgi:hypothetical protein